MPETLPALAAHCHPLLPAALPGLLMLCYLRERIQALDVPRGALPADD